MATKFSGADWLKSVSDKELSPFGVLVADVLGQVWAGIYHLQSEVLHKRVEWSHPYRIEIVIYGDLSTYDFDLLTKLVVLCHDNAIRFTVAPANSSHLRLMFHKRTRASAHISERHPSLEDAARGIRERIGLNEIKCRECGSGRVMSDSLRGVCNDCGYAWDSNPASSPDVCAFCGADVPADATKCPNCPAVIERPTTRQHSSDKDAEGASLNNAE